MLRKIGFFVLAVLLFSSTAWAVTVVGTNDPSVDVLEVSAAVNGGVGPSGTDYGIGGGTVTLQGTFDFGYNISGAMYCPDKWESGEASPLHRGESTVYVTKSVTIIGDGAIINRGFPAFFVGWDGYIFPSKEDMEADPPTHWPSEDYGRDWIPESPVYTPDWGDLVDYDLGIYAIPKHPLYDNKGAFRYFRVYKDIDVKIEGIESEQARSGFVSVGAGRDIEILNNTISDMYIYVTENDMHFWAVGFGPNRTGMGIVLLGNLVPPAYKMYPPIIGEEPSTGIHGIALVKGNTVKDSNASGMGISYTSAVPSIEGNTIDNINGTGIHCAGNLQPTTIKDNILTNISGRGMVIFGFKFLTDGSPLRVFHVTGNYIEAPKPLHTFGTIASTFTNNTLKATGGDALMHFDFFSLLWTVSDITADAGSTAKYGIWAARHPLIPNSGASGNYFSNIDLADLSVTDNYVYLECSTKGNAGGIVPGTEMQIPAGTTSGVALKDIGINNTFIFDPEPIADPITDLSYLTEKVECFNLQQGIDNSLDKKLSNALASLTAANAEQRNDAVDKLSSFISQCEDQSGNKLTAEQAAELIECAQDIIDALEAED